jgi:hypothetical protein
MRLHAGRLAAEMQLGVYVHAGEWIELPCPPPRPAERD